LEETRDKLLENQTKIVAFEVDKTKQQQKIFMLEQEAKNLTEKLEQRN
jgi:hypothetical protein